MDALGTMKVAVTDIALGALQLCCSGVTVVLQWCYSGGTVVLHYSGVTVVLLWYYSCITVVLQSPTSHSVCAKCDGLLNLS
jgi:hypothetical protein